MEPITVRRNAKNHEFKDLYDVVNAVRKRNKLETLGGMAMAIELFYHTRGIEMDPKAKHCIDVAMRYLDMKSAQSKPGLRSQGIETTQVKKMAAQPLLEEHV
jgi:hypothetical protein